MSKNPLCQEFFKAIGSGDPEDKQAANKLALCCIESVDKYDIAIHAMKYYKKQLEELKDEHDVVAIDHVVGDTFETMISRVDDIIMSLRNRSDTALADNIAIILKSMKSYVSALKRAEERIGEKLGHLPDELKEIQIEMDMTERRASEENS